MAVNMSLKEVLKLRAQLALAQDDLREAKAEAARVKAINADVLAHNAYLELCIEKMRREKYGRSSERTKLLDQLELTFEELQADAEEAERLAKIAAEKATRVKAFTRKRPAPRRSFDANIPREQRIIPAPEQCPCCGSHDLRSLPADVTETLEKIPAQYKVIQTVREKVACCQCDKISQPPAPFHVTSRGMFGPHFLASLIFQKYGLHQPLNSQRDCMASQGIDLPLSTLADQIGAASVALMPLFILIEAHVLAAKRLHGDDTTVPLLAKYKTKTARMWTYVRDDRPFAGDEPPAVLFYYSCNRRGEHPQNHLVHYTGILQVDRFAGYNEMFKNHEKNPPMTRANCWAHARRRFYELADIDKQMKRKKGRDKPVIISPIALEAVHKIDEIFAIETDINGLPAHERLDVRQEKTVPLVEKLKEWLKSQRAMLSKQNPVAKAIDYLFNDWDGFTAFLADGRICMTNNAAERELRAVARGRKAWLFVGSDRAGQRAAMMYSLIGSARLNDIDPLAWLTDVLDRIADLHQNQLHSLLPWNWKKQNHTNQPPS